jgi:murein DD-endopeptidase MepM/ murein hydrolase activator NlpD
MRSVTNVIVLIMISLSVFVLGFNYNNSEQPNNYYQVYLDDQVVGIIKSKNDLLDYINKRNESVMQEYNIDEVLTPEGVEIKKIVTFDNKVDSVKDVYKKILEKRDLTISGYKITLTNGDESKKIYVTDEKIFRDAVNEAIKIFVGTDDYNLYLNDEQQEIETTGRIITNVYVEENITIKKTNIPVKVDDSLNFRSEDLTDEETVYNDYKKLARYLVFGTTKEQKTYRVEIGDTIESIAFKNEISVEEFLISNPSFKNASGLLFPGQQVVIGITNSQIKVLMQEYVVKDIVSKYDTEYITDSTLFVGQKRVVRTGVNGLVRVTQEETSINGSVDVVSDPINREELKAPVNQIVRIGDKPLPSNVGSLYSWGWPTKSGWTITSPYGWRINPISGVRELHDGIDIAGTGQGSPIYAVNNGTVTTATYHPVNGNYVIINHNNGYYTLYAHLNKIYVNVGEVVVRGQVIATMGRTGWATGTHLHYSIYNTKPFTGTKAINPWSMY